MGKGLSCIFVCLGIVAKEVSWAVGLLNKEAVRRRTGLDVEIVSGFPAETGFVETNFEVQLSAFRPPR
jgi:hypothetical protein